MPGGPANFALPVVPTVQKAIDFPVLVGTVAAFFGAGRGLIR